MAVYVSVSVCEMYIVGGMYVRENNSVAERHLTEQRLDR